MSHDLPYTRFDYSSQDTLLTFEATINLKNGQQLTDQAYVLAQNDAINDENGFFPRFSSRTVTREIHPYIANGPWADVLRECVYNNQVSTSCRFNRLPLLGMEKASPDVNDIMQRVLVSHDWMGDRFKEFLQQSTTAQDMFKLLGATTAIVISYDVRPSFYWSATGAIYLDGNNFWRTPQERDSLNDIPDFRSSFGQDLQFLIAWRYVKDNQYYLRSYPHETRNSRNFAALESELAWLMYHELAHANDFFPPRIWQQISRQSSPLNYSNDNQPDSKAVTDLSPLNSNTLKQLAQVRFAGTQATESQKALQAGGITNQFRPDRGIMFYSYFTPQEDYALLFERYMMSYRLGVSGDVGIISKINNPALNVSWGQRGRVNNSQLQLRVRESVSRILPDLDLNSINLPPATPLTPGIPWRENQITNGQSVQRHLRLDGLDHYRPQRISTQ